MTFLIATLLLSASRCQTKINEITWKNKDRSADQGVTPLRPTAVPVPTITVVDPTPTAPPTPTPDFYGGGTMADPYLVSSPLQLDLIGQRPVLWDKYFKLTNNIDMATFSSNQFHPIGNFARSYPESPMEQYLMPIPNTQLDIVVDAPFTGGFDGDGFTISNFTYVKTDESFVGMFRYIKNASIKNLTLENPMVRGLTVVGGVVGIAVDSRIERIKLIRTKFSGTGAELDAAVTGTYDSSNSFYDGMTAAMNILGDELMGCVGGVVGALYKGDSIGSVIEFAGLEGVRIFGHRGVGGIAGCVIGSSIQRSYADHLLDIDPASPTYFNTNLMLRYSMGGGIAGLAQYYSKIENSYTKDVSDYAAIAGYLGYSSTLSNVYFIDHAPYAIWIPTYDKCNVELVTGSYLSTVINSGCAMDLNFFDVLWDPTIWDIANISTINNDPGPKLIWPNN